MLRPAAEGTGVIAGGAVRVVLELAGVKNGFGKQLGERRRACRGGGGGASPAAGPRRRRAALVLCAGRGALQRRLAAAQPAPPPAAPCAPGTANPLNNARATLEGIKAMRTFRQVSEERGIPVADLMGLQA